MIYENYVIFYDGSKKTEPAHRTGSENSHDS
jgi:hypothetical protein